MLKVSLDKLSNMLSSVISSPAHNIKLYFVSDNMSITDLPLLIVPLDTSIPLTISIFEVHQKQDYLKRF